MLKVTYMGSPLCQIYPHATRFQVFKYRFAQIMRKVIIASFIIGAIVGAYKFGNITTKPEAVYAVNEIDTSDVRYTVKIEGLKKEVIEELRKCESAGYKENDGLVIFDSNSKGSFGTLQFQKATVIHFYKVLYNKDITGKEAVMIALDDIKSGQLAQDVAFKTKNKIGKDWVNCERKLGLDERVDLIKKMEVI